MEGSGFTFEGVEQMGGLIRRRLRQLRIPVFQRRFHLVPGLDHFGDLAIGRLQHPLRRRTDIVAGLAAAVADPEEARDLAERKAKPLCIPDQGQAVDHALAVLAVAGFRPDRLRHEPDPLVIPDGVAGFSRARGDFAYRQECGHGS
jgi:hypothetical protein